MHIYIYTITANTNACSLSFLAPTQNVPGTVKSIRSCGMSEHGSVHFTWSRAGTARTADLGSNAWEMGLGIWWHDEFTVYLLRPSEMYIDVLVSCVYIINSYVSLQMPCEGMWGPCESRIAWTCFGQIASEKTTCCKYHASLIPASGDSSDLGSITYSASYL